MSERRSRRALLVGGAGAVVAGLAGLFGRPFPGRAADGDPLTAGSELSASSTTTITTTVGHGVAGRSWDHTASGLFGEGVTGGTGVHGRSNSRTGYPGVLAENLDQGPGLQARARQGTAIEAASEHGVAVHGSAAGATAILGESATGTGIRGTSESGYGVQGFSRSHVALHGSSITFAGVYGQSDSSYGVKAYSDRGSAVHATTSTGYAIEAFDRLGLYRISGVATIPAGSDSVVVPLRVAVSQTSFVLLTAMTDIGPRNLWYTTDPQLDRITIRLSSARSRATPVSWLMLG